MKIKECIVVEGKDDTTAIKKAVDADTIETNGSAINQVTLEKIKRAKNVRGVIVFTDPDYPGERIRKIISEHVPGCKHAFLPRSEAKGKENESLGVEHASVEAIRAALSEAKVEYIADEVEEITYEDLIDAQLIAGVNAKRRREKLGLLLKIGYCNGKQLHKRLQMFCVSKEEFIAALNRVLQEEQNDE